VSVSHPSLLPLGHAAPDFRLLDQAGRSLSLRDDMGEKGLILLFYSTFWLPGDVSLLKTFGQAHPELQKAGLGVYAISGLNWETQYDLAKKIQSPFPLLFDPCCRLSRDYRSMMIHKFVTGRAVYGVNPQGQVVFAHKKAAADDVSAAFKL